MNMSRLPPLDRTAAFGLAACSVALLLIVASRNALAGWLVAFVFWTSLPLGALCLVLMMRVIPGGWRQALGREAEAAARRLPLAALSSLPILIGVSTLYPWAGTAQPTAFRAVYFSPLLFCLRTAIFFAVAMIAAAAPRPRLATPAAVLGLILFTLLDTTMGFDWLMSLDPHFHSSGFGLYFLSVQMTTALALLIVKRLGQDDAGDQNALIGGLLLTALLLWAYFAFMQYFITWSDNYSVGALWYGRRGVSGWAAVEYAIGILHGAPILLLLFPPMRRSRFWLLLSSIAVLGGKALETAWLVLPSRLDGDLAAAAAGAFAFAGLGALTMASLAAARSGIVATGEAA